MVKLIITLIVTLAIVINFVSAEDCAAVGYQDRAPADRSDRCPSDNRCCNNDDTERIEELFEKQRERCWTDDFNNSRQALNEFFDNYEDLIEEIVENSAMDSFGGISTTSDREGDYYDDVVDLNGEDIGEAARDFIRDNTSIDPVRVRFVDAVCSLIASRVLEIRFSNLEDSYFICGDCLCNKVLGSGTTMTLRDLVTRRFDAAWTRYYRHLQNLREIFNRIRNISSEGTANRQILDLCEAQSIRLLGCRRCAGSNQGACSDVCTSLVYFCREAYRRVVLIYQRAPRIFMDFASSLGNTENSDGNEFSTGNTRDIAETISRDFAGLAGSGFDAFNNANRGNTNVSTQLCIFKIPSDDSREEETRPTDDSSEDGTRPTDDSSEDGTRPTDDSSEDGTRSSDTRQSCSPPGCVGCGDLCKMNKCKQVRTACTVPDCKGCPARGVTKCECLQKKRTMCSGGRRKRDVALRRRDVSDSITRFQDLARQANVRGSMITIDSIFQMGCVCGSTLNRYREIALNDSDNCYNPFSGATPSGNFTENPIYRSLNLSQQMAYAEGASSEALTNNLDTFELAVMEGSNAVRMSYSIVTVLMTLMLMLILS